jgi:UDP-N-acetylglucosamine 2-epimerase (non-hydrolysing)
MKIRVLSVFGTRPEAIKMAPVIRELERRSDLIESRVAVTAQHREMLDQVLRVFDIEPDHDLAIMKPGQDLFDVTGAALAGLKQVLAEERPDLLVVQGDTTTTFVGALAAFYCQIPIGHVEAGLRTYAKYAPFPEEINRVLTTHLADLHFAPTDRARDALAREGVAAERIFVTGNPVIDALHLALRQPCRLEPELEEALSRHERVILLTTHRRENLGGPLREIYLALCHLLDRYQDLAVIFPVHKNPEVRREVARVLQGQERVYLTEPMDYLPLINVMKRAYLVLTDSGGIQEEAPALGKPVLVLRDVTERPEATLFGTARLVGANRRKVEEEVALLLDSREAYEVMANAVNPYGDGRAALRIVQAILSHWRLGPPPEPFRPSEKREAGASRRPEELRG